MSLFLLVFLLAAFHREILSLIVRHLGQGQEYFSPKAEIRLLAQVSRRVRLHLMQRPLCEVLVIPFFFQSCVYVQQELWDSLSLEEQESLLAWAIVGAERSTVIHRLLGPFDPRTIDRETLLLSQNPLAFPQILEKMKVFRYKNPPTAWGTLLLGLSVLGPSLIPGGPNAEIRTKSYVDQLTRLKK